MSGKILVIAEKPSVATDLARILDPSCRKGNGCLEGEKLVVSWALGHLVGLADAEEYDSRFGRWRLGDLPILPETMRYRPLPKGREQLAVLLRLLSRRDVVQVVNACDAGREGELIFRSIHAQSRAAQPVLRLWLSETTPEAVRRAWQVLRNASDFDRLGAAATARAEADWLVGINATRVFSVRHRQKLTVGRVQTPTLALLVDREREIRSFVITPFWQVEAEFAAAGGTYRGLWFQPAKNGVEEVDRLATEAEAIAIAKAAPGPATVEKAERQVRDLPPPLLPNLSDLQRAANSRYGLSAARTLAVAQSLYERRLISYPRSDSRHLSRALAATAPERLAALSALPPYAPLADRARQGGLQALLRWGRRFVDDARVSDHHAIVPTDRPPRTPLTGQEALVYDLVVRHFLAAFFPAARIEQVEVVTAGALGHRYRTRGRSVLVPGWQEALPPAKSREKKGREEAEDSETDGFPLPPLTAGQPVQLVEARVREGKTRPPNRYNEAALLGAMEGAGKMVEDEELRAAMKSAGLGTPATRAAIIEKLIATEYVEREGKALVPTVKGEALIGVVPERLRQVELTAAWEEQLAGIERGEVPPERFGAAIRDFVRQVVEEGRESELSLPAAAAPAASSFGVCPLCGAPVREFPKSWSCSAFRSSGCSFTIWKRIAGKTLTPLQARMLLEKRSTRLLKGFRSKAGKSFAARLVLGAEGQVEFSFDRGEAGGQGSRTRGRKRPVDG